MDNEEDCECVSAVEFESVFPVAYEKSSKVNKYGSAPVYVVNGIPTPISQDEHYAYRGTELRFLSLYEYASLISIIKKPGKETSKKSKNFPHFFVI